MCNTETKWQNPLKDSNALNASVYTLVASLLSGYLYLVCTYSTLHSLEVKKLHLGTTESRKNLEQNRHP